MRYLLHKALKRLHANLPAAGLVILASAALAGMAFVYTLNQFYNMSQIGTGADINISFLPTDLSTSVGLVITALFVSVFTTLFTSRGDFIRGMACLFAAGTLTLSLVAIAYVMPGLVGAAVYLPDYYTFVAKQVMVVGITLFPVMMVGGVVGMLLYDRIGPTAPVKKEPGRAGKA
jgi:hypothetical protein